MKAEVILQAQVFTVVEKGKKKEGSGCGKPFAKHIIYTCQVT